MDTRSRKPAKLSEDKLEASRQTMAKQDERMRSEAVLQKQREEFEKQRTEFVRERELENDCAERENSDLSETLASFKA